jgi:hypothetical protein
MLSTIIYCIIRFTQTVKVKWKSERYCCNIHELEKPQKPTSGGGADEVSVTCLWPHLTLVCLVYDILKSGTSCSNLSEQTYKLFKLK